jgi:DNA mismatch repair protein MSH6
MVENEDEDKISEENVTFLYKLSEGACPKSYGFNAARLAGVPVNIVKRAHDIATKLETEVNLRHAFVSLCTLKDSSTVLPILNKIVF